MEWFLPFHGFSYKKSKFKIVIGQNFFKYQPIFQTFWGTFNKLVDEFFKENILSAI